MTPPTRPQLPGDPDPLDVAEPMPVDPRPFWHDYSDEDRMAYALAALNDPEVLGEKAKAMLRQRLSAPRRFGCSVLPFLLALLAWAAIGWVLGWWG